jgi:exopolyphosphatase/guanosine-5'-triphosphate,3'-diphosphate pyrophosphatase
VGDSPGSTQPVACIDIGTNSVLLLVAERVGTQVRAVHERAMITRLGQGVDVERRLSAAGTERTLG